MNESTLLSIKQFSALTGLSVSTLRYYDEIGILPPVARGENNYRYYTPPQIITVNFIQVLVDLGIQLSVIKELKDERTPEHLIELLGHQEDRLDSLFNELRTAYSIIHTYRRNILTGIMAEDGLVRIEDLPVANYMMGDECSFPDDSSFYEPFIAFCNEADENRINLKYPVGAIHHNIDSYMESPGRPDRFISMDPFGNRVRPAGQYLVGYKRGYYGQFGDLTERMNAYAEEHQLYFHGPVFSVYLLDEISVANPDDYLSSVAVRVSKRRKEPTDKASSNSGKMQTKLLLEQLRRNSNS